MDIKRNYLPCEVNISKYIRLMGERIKFSWLPDSLPKYESYFYFKQTIISHYCSRMFEIPYSLVSNDVLLVEYNGCLFLTSLISLFSSRCVQMWGGM